MKGNEPAFPQPIAVTTGEAPIHSGDFHGGEGLTKREWMATMILSGMCSDSETILAAMRSGSAQAAYELFASAALKQADGLLAELNKVKGDGQPCKRSEGMSEQPELRSACCDSPVKVCFDEFSYSSCCYVCEECTNTCAIRNPEPELEDR